MEGKKEVGESEGKEEERESERTKVPKMFLPSWDMNNSPPQILSICPPSVCFPSLPSILSGFSYAFFLFTVLVSLSIITCASVHLPSMSARQPLYIRPCTGLQLHIST